MHLLSSFKESFFALQRRSVIVDTPIGKIDETRELLTTSAITEGEYQANTPLQETTETHLLTPEEVLLLEKLFKLHNLHVFNFIYRLTNSNAPWAEDISQEVFSKLAEVIASHKVNLPTEDKAWKGYIFQIAHNTFIDFFVRKNKKKVGDQDMMISFEEFAENRVNDAAVSEGFPEELLIENIMLRKALSKLGPKYRIPIILQVVYGYKINQICEELHKPAGTIKMRLKRGKEQLKRAYEEVTQELGQEESDNG